jgi:Ser/Thr protein kinase RdoA (MazF antagonist)
MKDLNPILSQFDLQGTVAECKPLGNGLINDTFVVRTAGDDTPDYVLQRINHNIFTDVEGLQRNIQAVTTHIRRKLEAAGETDIDRKVLHFINVKCSDKTYYFDGESYWRVMVFIPRSRTFEAVTPESSRDAGRAFGQFQAMLVDIPETLTETIPDFHNMEFRLKQLREAVAADAVGRVKEVQPLLDELEARAEEMCKAERLHREGKLPKRICHCDTKVNNMMFDEDGKTVLCVIDLDTVMPSFIFSDFGDFMRTGANTGLEDDKNLDNVEFNMEIFRAFTEGYLSTARSFLLPIEIENLPYAAALFPYMQTVRFLADYINGDTYYKIQYPEHNLVRSKAQFKLLQSVEAHTPEMHAFIAEKLK